MIWCENLSIQIVYQSGCQLLDHVIHQLSAEDAINSAQDFYRVQKPCSSIECKYFGQLLVEVSLFTFH